MFYTSYCVDVKTKKIFKDIVILIQLCLIHYLKVPHYDTTLLINKLTCKKHPIYTKSILERYQKLYNLTT